MQDFTASARRLADEKLISLADAAKLLPSARASRRGHCDSYSLLRWILRGKRGVYLDAVRGMGKTWWTSREALIRFQATLSEVEAKRAEPPSVPSPCNSKSQSAIDRLKAQWSRP